MAKLFAICPTCGRYIVGNPDHADAEAAVQDWANEHAAGVQLFEEQPEGWPAEVSGVRSNGHRKVTLATRKLCGACAVAWPCPTYAETARRCPANGLGLVAEAPTSPDA